MHIPFSFFFSVKTRHYRGALRLCGQFFPLYPHHSLDINTNNETRSGVICLFLRLWCLAPTHARGGLSPPTEISAHNTFVTKGFEHFPVGGSFPLLPLSRAVPGRRISLPLLSCPSIQASTEQLYPTPFGCQWQPLTPFSASTAFQIGRVCAPHRPLLPRSTHISDRRT